MLKKEAKAGKFWLDAAGALRGQEFNETPLQRFTVTSR